MSDSLDMLDVVIAAEDESDARRVRDLVDRLLVAEIEWLREQPDLLDSLRSWRGHTPASTYLDIHKIHALADACELPRPYGGFDGRPAAPDYRSAVRAMWLLTALQRPGVFVWVRDTDGDRARIQGWKDACASAGSEFDVLIGAFPHECMEAWLLAAWSPQSAHDKAALVAERRRLEFDPVARPERLSHKHNAFKSAKTVCDALEVDKEQVLTDADLDDLTRRGRKCGLTHFIDDVRQRLVPVARGPYPRTTNEVR